MAEPGTRPAGRRSHFAPVVLLGLAASALAALASAKPWLAVPGTRTDAASMTGTAEGATYPLAAAVSLVLLASWGVLLVTRGRVRRTFAVLAAVAAAALAGSVVAGRNTLSAADLDPVTRSLGRSLGSSTDVAWTGWFWVAAVASVLALVAGVLACRLAPRWPEMGRRYDAPGAMDADADRQVASLDTDRDLWRALDEGRDPTRDRARDRTREP